ncbi:LPS export ABC transporter permease LptF [Vannielia litorea]|nr:LPS export ABC transporter permease LptF [Vannielia litorea]MBY6047706.1 LPS export ABC transporter permease LptF [Vannielia litorea]MBY6075120.1 LPS export ABC transporter permease LptF [Vannielia litorea]MBY6152358.1 LPS export ABC transporter permease LptF [Vannielia litorea]
MQSYSGATVISATFRNLRTLSLPRHHCLFQPRPRSARFPGNQNNTAGAVRVPKYDRYILSQLLVLFGFFSLVLVSVYWVNRAVILFDQLIADGQSAGVFVEFTALSLPNVIRLVLPMAAFVATVYATNRLASESELVVIQATGFSSWRMARPVLFFGLFVALLMAALVHVLVPTSRGQLAERQAEIANNITSRFLTEGRFLHPADGITFYIRQISPEGELRDVFLSDARNPGERTTYTATRAFLVRQETGPKLVMFDGAAQTLSAETERLFTTAFSDFSYDIGALITAREFAMTDIRHYPTPALFAPTPEILEITGRSPAEFTYEANLRIAQPFMALVAALIGFATLITGSFSRFGVWRQILVAVGLLIVVQVLETVAAGAARKDAALWPLVYVPILVGLAITAALLWYADRPFLFTRRRRVNGTAEAAA